VPTDAVPAGAAVPPGAVSADRGVGADDAVPVGVRMAAAWSWRLLVITAVLAVVGLLIARLHLIVVPVVVALLLSAVAQPAAAWLARAGWPRPLAAATVVLGGLGLISLVVWLVVRAFRRGYGDLAASVRTGLDDARNWLVNGPLGLSQQQLDHAAASVRRSLSDNRDLLTSGALSTATTVGHVLTGVLLALFTTFFFVKDGRQIWLWITGLLPRRVRDRVDQAGLRSWGTLISYVRATMLVALVDALGIGLAVAILGVPLALPLGVLVLLGSFIPLIGATLTGLVAVLVALVSKGLLTGLLVLAAVIAVQQLEGHVLQPLLLGRAVRIHPLAVALSIATGVLLAGIVGALVAVPLVAVLNTGIRALAEPAEPVAAPTPPAGP